MLNLNIMRKYIFVSLFVLLVTSLSSQTFKNGRDRRGHNHDYIESITVGRQGSLQYENNKGFRASLSNEIGAKVYKDNRNNEVLYSKEVWNEVLQYFDNDEKEFLYWQADMHRKVRNLKEQFDYSFGGDLEYRTNKGFKASLSINYSNDLIYQDSDNNEAFYSKNIWEKAFFDIKDSKYMMLSDLIYMYSGKSNNKEKYKYSFRGDLEYERNNDFKATFSKDIFDNRIYKDSRGNEVSYSKEVWFKLYPDLENDQVRALFLLSDIYYGKNNYKEKYKYNIHGDLEYENNSGVRASLSKDIFDNKVYKDNKHNEIKYSKEFWQDIIADFENDEIRFFLWEMNECGQLNNYREEYKIDIFGYQQYRNSKGETASLSKDIFDKFSYKDSRGSKIEFNTDMWNRMLKKEGSANKAFISLIHRYLFQ